MVAHDIYIVFYNFKNNSELVYVANNVKAGDGVDAIAGKLVTVIDCPAQSLCRNIIYKFPQLELNSLQYIVATQKICDI